MKTGITGGIGSGKSYVCKRLQARGFEVYDCDEAAKHLIRTSPDIHRQLTALIGPDAYHRSPLSTPPYTLNKAAVAQFLLQSEENAKAIDAIVHPAVFQDFEESGMEWMESAIIYESGIHRLVDRVIVVTAPEDIRIQRIVQRDGITTDKAREWLSRQWPQDKGRLMADYEIVNDGSKDLEQQIDKIIKTL
jgi:dephospho-CoA kinase